MMTKRVSIFFLAILLAAGTVSAADAPLTLPDLARLAADGNPQIRAARQAAQAALQARNAAGILPDPELMLSYSFATEGEEPDKWTLEIDQRFPPFGTLAASRRLADERGRAARLAVEKTVRDVTLDVATTYHELRYLAEARRIAAQNRELLDLLRGAGEAAYDGSRVAFVDVAKLQSQAAQLGYDDLLLADRETALRARLVSLLGNVPGSPLPALAPYPLPASDPDPDEARRLAASRRTEVLLAEAMVGAAGAEAEMASAETRPMLTAGLMAERGMVGLRLGTTLPVWWGRNRALRDGAAATSASAAGEREAMVREGEAMVEEALFALRNARRLATLYRDELVPQADRSLLLADTWFRAGEGSLSDYVETAAVRYSFQLAEARARADHGIALARLAALTGGDPAAVAGAPSAATPPSLAPGNLDGLQQLRDTLPIRPGQGPAFVADPALAERLAPAATDVAAATAALADGFTLRDLEHLAVLRSPEVSRTWREFEATREGYEQATALTDLSSRYAAFAAGLMPGAGPMTGDSPTMLAPFPGILALRGEIVAMEVAAAFERSQAAVAATVGQARAAWWTLASNRASEAILVESLAVADRLIPLIRSRYETGGAPFSAMVDAKVRRERVENELLSLRDERSVAEGAIRALLALPAGIPVGAPARSRPDTRIPAVEELDALALERNQMLREQRAMIGATERMILMAETETEPRVTLDLAVPSDRLGLPAEGGMGGSFPVATTAAAAGLPKRPLIGPQQAYLRAARRRLAAQRDALRQAEAETLQRVRESVAALASARRAIDLNEGRIAELTGIGYDTALKGYEAGTAMPAETLDRLAMRLDARLEAERSRADAGIARAELERTLGAPLPAPNDSRKGN